MGLYAMLKNNKVIDVVVSESKPRWPKTNAGVPVIAVACSEGVRAGMIYNQTDGTFVFPAKVEAEFAPSQLDRIEAKIQTNEDLQSFYDDVMKEVGL